jgi:hypothetical protein
MLLCCGNARVLSGARWRGVLARQPLFQRVNGHVQDWQTDPFKMMSKDGYLYGRGTSDNKGPILAMIFAIKEMLDKREGLARAGLPVNLAFVFEGALRDTRVQLRCLELVHACGACPIISPSAACGQQMRCRTLSE